MVGFIEEHRGEYGVEPICAQLPIAPATYYTHAARRRDPEQRPARAKRDEVLRVQIRRVWQESSAASMVPRRSGDSSFGGHRGRPLHRRAADAGDGPAWSGPGPGVHQDDGG